MVTRSERLADTKEETQQLLSIITNNTPVAWNEEMYRHAMERVLKPWR
jgi:hypothetical protein